MPKCDYCGKVTRALHTGGDGRIAGDGVESGACSECEPLLASAARVAIAKVRTAKLAAIAASNDPMATAEAIARGKLNLTPPTAPLTEG